jgi:hypothetical protein
MNITSCDEGQAPAYRANLQSADQNESYLLRSGREHAALRNTFAGSRKQAAIDVTCLENAPEEIDKPSIPHPPPNTLKKQPVMNRIEGRYDTLPTSKLHSL